MKSIDVEQSNSDGTKRVVQLHLKKSPRPRFALPFTQVKRERKLELVELRERTLKILNEVASRAFEEQRSNEELTTGEKELLLKPIKSRSERVLLNIRNKPVTMRLLLNIYDSDKTTHEAMLKVVKSLEFIYGAIPKTNEQLAFFDVCDDSLNQSSWIENIKLSHPMFAYDDLSCLDDETIAMVKTLLLASYRLYDAKKDEHRNRRKDIGYDLQRVRLEIAKANPYMTPALARVFIEQPHRAESVMDMLVSRNVYLPDADDLINEYASANPNLATGAL